MVGAKVIETEGTKMIGGRAVEFEGTKTLGAKAGTMAGKAGAVGGKGTAVKIIAAREIEREAGVAATKTGTTLFSGKVATIKLLGLSLGGWTLVAVVGGACAIGINYYLQQRNEKSA